MQRSEATASSCEPMLRPVPRGGRFPLPFSLVSQYSMCPRRSHADVLLSAGKELPLRPVRLLTPTMETGGQGVGNGWHRSHDSISQREGL
jgi:hypothetical protein